MQKQMLEKLFRLTDYSYNRCVDDLWTGSYSLILHENEDWEGGLIVTIYMEGVSFFSEVFNGDRIFCDVIVQSLATGKLYYTKRAYLSDDLVKQTFRSEYGW